MTMHFEQVAARYGTYWHNFTPGAKLAICGLARPIWPADSIGVREQCPNCRKAIAKMAEALARQ